MYVSVFNMSLTVHNTVSCTDLIIYRNFPTINRGLYIDSVKGLQDIIGCSLYMGMHYFFLAREVSNVHINSAR